MAILMVSPTRSVLHYERGQQVRHADGRVGVFNGYLNREGWASVRFDAGGPHAVKVADLTCPFCGHGRHDGEFCGGTADCDCGLELRCCCSYPDPDNYVEVPPL